MDMLWGAISEEYLQKKNKKQRGEFRRGQRESGRTICTSKACAGMNPFLAGWGFIVYASPGDNEKCDDHQSTAAAIQY
jgi:hypothetical protein